MQHFLFLVLIAETEQKMHSDFFQFRNSFFACKSRFYVLMLRNILFDSDEKYLALHQQKH